ncbi:KAP family NTPase [Microbacterium aurugineum]|uniref:KAP family NTPase n=1 Tax=Microbacterium aurugineum TaxID=2851642 RepID=A0ABY4J461_9MICO|nr:KAP family NTPase [Microbacterium aurugineum]UPL18643.1 KAP family NTPase [Microbacterium aurugineum]
MQVLSAEDLVPDEPLGAGAGGIGEKDDLLHHRVLARRTAELAVSSPGNANIALFGPWGSGKSSFNALLREELGKQSTKTQHITFDAWKNAGSGFRTNFLSEVAAQLKADVKISDKLFQATTSVQGPLSDRKWSPRARFFILIGVLLGVFFGLPALWTGVQLLSGVKRTYFSLFVENIGGFANMAAGGTLIVVVALAIIELSKVTVSKSTPSHVAQFGKLFEEILETKKKHRFVIFVDELDRCTPSDVMATLEGLRTFLGHKECVFVVAFDREAVAGVIASQLKESAPRDNAAPYYRTSGEYLDKIFQFQLALPPQPVHTFRRFASSLVRERGGVWGQLRSHDADLLDRVVNILSPMHLASPRRTKVLLNDFAVNARIYEGMNFEWLDRAEEIAVLTVLQTEFPRLAADLEREPALMRYLYRPGTAEPTRPSLLELVNQYVGEDKRDTALDEVVGEDDADEVKEQLEENLERYLRLLRERNVPEPRADLIMMHSDGSLLAFDDPGVYHELLSAADMPRADLLNGLNQASDRDLGEAIRYLLDQTEKESKGVSDRLVVLAGEIAAELVAVEPDIARLLEGRVSTAISGMSVQSLQGYGRAATVGYRGREMRTILDVAQAQTGEGVAKVIWFLQDSIRDKDWPRARTDMLPAVLRHAVAQPDVASAFFTKFSEDLDAKLTFDEIKELAAALSATAPEPVEPTAATAAAKTVADEQDAENKAAYEQQREAYRGIAAEITAGWAEFALGSTLRRDLLRVLRRADTNRGFLDLHDSLIDQDIERGQGGEANSLLMDAIFRSPTRAKTRWVDRLDGSETVSAASKHDALHAVVKLVTDSNNESVREGGAIAAQRVASVPSDEFDLSSVVELIRGDLETDWDEYSDSRFETQLRLLAILDSLGSDVNTTDGMREKLYLGAVASAQAEAAAVDVIVASLGSEKPAFAERIATAMLSKQPWDEASPELALGVILAAHHRALSGGIAIVHLPVVALSAVSDPKIARSLRATWVSTAPPVTDIEKLPSVTTLPQDAWHRFGQNADEIQRGQAWRLLAKKEAHIGDLRALSEPGQPLDVYEEAGDKVRTAKTIPARERAVKVFLALPVRREAADEVRAMVKVMAQDNKRGELALGILLLKAYVGVVPGSAVKSLRPLVSSWAEEGEGLVAKRDISWLVNNGFATKNSSLWDVVKKISKR